MKYDVVITTFKTGAKETVGQVIADTQIDARKAAVASFWGNPVYNPISQQMSVIPAKKRA